MSPGDPMGQDPQNHEQPSGYQSPPPPPSSPMPPPVMPVYPPMGEPPKKTSGWRIFWRVVLVLSVIANIFLFLCVLGLGAAFVTGQGDLFASRDIFDENVLVKGDVSKKIVVIRLEGVIDGKMSSDVIEQIEAAGKDKRVKALIVRTISPGGSVSASDQIHHEISKFREKTKKPAIAFMQSVAASGGYYTSVACDRIVAEPTVITGSIGVIMAHLTVQELLEDKLGIVPVVIKSGPKKDWPSVFHEATEEQKQYLMDKLISPAYERFVGLVAEGRKHVLDEAQVRRLADGSIYGATEAYDNQLIDEIGYLEKAVETAESLAQIEGAHVVEYSRQFSFSKFLAAENKSLLKLDQNALREMATPQLMYLWHAGW